MFVIVLQQNDHSNKMLQGISIYIKLQNLTSTSTKFMWKLVSPHVLSAHPQISQLSLKCDCDEYNGKTTDLTYFPLY